MAHVYCHETAHILTRRMRRARVLHRRRQADRAAGHGRQARAGILAAPLATPKPGVHHCQPAAVSVTQATEWGTVYTPRRDRGPGDVARAHGLRMHMDGARLANAIAHLGCSPAEATWRAGVDVLSLRRHQERCAWRPRRWCSSTASSRSRLRAPPQARGPPHVQEALPQRPLVAMLEDGLWLRHASTPTSMAERLALASSGPAGLRAGAGGRGQRAVRGDARATDRRPPREGFEFHRWSGGGSRPAPVVRLVTGFATTEADVDGLLRAAGSIAG